MSTTEAGERWWRDLRSAFHTALLDRGETHWLGWLHFERAGLNGTPRRANDNDTPETAERRRALCTAGDF